LKVKARSGRLGKGKEQGKLQKGAKEKGKKGSPLLRNKQSEKRNCTLIGENTLQ